MYGIVGRHGIIGSSRELNVYGIVGRQSIICLSRELNVHGIVGKQSIIFKFKYGIGIKCVCDSWETKYNWFK